MLAALIRFSIRYHGIVLIIALLVVSYGGYRFNTAGLDIFPEFSPKKVIIQTEAPGFATEPIETLITRPIEKSILGLMGLETVRSESIQGLSIVTAIFREGSDLYRCRQLISERLAALAPQLPPGISPVAVPLSSSSATLMTLGLTSDGTDLMALRTLADWTLAPRLLAVPGVADVNVFGGDVAQLQIQVNPYQLRRFDLDLATVIDTAGRASALRNGGFVETGNQRLLVQTVGQPLTPDQFADVAVRQIQGRTVTLGEIADIRYAPEPPIGAAQIMGKAGVVMMVIGQYGANTLTVSKRLEKILSELEPSLARQGIQLHGRLFRPADYIERSLANLSGHLILGGVFVMAVLFSFLFDVRAAFISAAAIPVSLLGAAWILLLVGVHLNIMVLGGLAIALGEVVDDAIIDTENIFRRLRENRLRAEPEPIADVIFKASLEVRGSVVYASFIVALVFVPLLTLGGVAGRLFAPLAIAYIAAILVSLLVALTLTPALCRLLLGNDGRQLSDPPLLKRLQPLYSRWLVKSCRRLRALTLIALIVCALGVAALFGLNSQFLPELREGHYIVHTASIPGTSLRESLRIGQRLGARFQAIAGVESVSQWAGRSERGADTYGSHYSEYEIRLRPLSGAGQQRIKDHLRAILTAFPGINFEVNTFLTERIDETISGYTSPVAVNIYGDDLDRLDVQARRIAGIMADLPGAAEIQVRSPPTAPTLDIVLDPDRLRYRGLQPSAVVDTVQAAFTARIVGKFAQTNRSMNIAVTLAPEFRARPEAIGLLPLRTPEGAMTTLSEVADIRPTESRYNILHQGGQRRQTVTCNVVDVDYDGFIRTLKQRLTDELAPADTEGLEFTGAAFEQAQTRRELILHALLAGAGVLILIYLSLGSLRPMLLTLCNLPFALIGGVAAVVLTGAAVSAGSIVGFVTLFGITVRNSIMLISHYRHLTEREGRQWNLKTAVLGAGQRLPSILMTALVTALAMLPIAVNSDNPGREIMGPMAAIVIGGLFSSTLLNLVLLPGLLLRYGQFRPPPSLRQ